jgi:hypothetical protein
MFFTDVKLNWYAPLESGLKILLDSSAVISQDAAFKRLTLSSPDCFS